MPTPYRLPLFAAVIASFLAGSSASAQVITSVELASRASDGSIGAGSSTTGAISEDGTSVVFASDSRLVPEDTSPVTDIYLRDFTDGSLTRVNVAQGGIEGDAPSGQGGTLGLSIDGKTGVFSSSATNLVFGDTNNVEDVFIFDRFGSDLARLSVSRDGAEGSAGSFYPGIASDASRVIFGTAASLDNTDTNSFSDVYVHDRRKLTYRACMAFGGGDPNSDVFTPTISGDGKWVTFTSGASNFIGSPVNPVTNAYRCSVATKRAELVASDAAGNPANAGSRFPVLSTSGRYVAFASDADNLVTGDTNGKSDVFVKDTQSKAIERVSVGTDGTQSDDNSGINPISISSDGRFVVFDSVATNLAPGDIAGVQQVYLRDRQEKTTIRLSQSVTGEPANALARSTAYAIGGDGKKVVYQSNASNLGPADTNGRSDIYLATLDIKPPILTPDTELTAPSVSAGGKSAVVNLRQFAGAVSKKGSNVKVRYFVTIKPVGRAGTLQKQASARPSVSKTSNKPTVSFRNLPPGNYSASYRGQGVSSGKVTFQTKPSSPRPFSLP